MSSPPASVIISIETPAFFCSMSLFATILSERRNTAILMDSVSHAIKFSSFSWTGSLFEKSTATCGALIWCVCMNIHKSNARKNRSIECLCIV